MDKKDSDRIIWLEIFKEYSSEKGGKSPMKIFELNAKTIKRIKNINDIGEDKFFYKSVTSRMTVVKIEKNKK